MTACVDCDDPATSEATGKPRCRRHSFAAALRDAYRAGWNPAYPKDEP